MPDWITAAIAAISLILSVINFFWNRNLTSRQLKISQGQIELEMSAQLSSAKKYADSYAIMVYDLLSDEEKRSLILNKQKSVMEEVLNSYECLCQKYLDDKTDKERFEKAYNNEIRCLYGPNSDYREMLDRQSSPYKAIKEVYEQWNNHERK